MKHIYVTTVFPLNYTILVQNMVVLQWKCNVPQSEATQQYTKTIQHRSVQ